MSESSQIGARASRQLSAAARTLGRGLAVATVVLGVTFALGTVAPPAHAQTDGELSIARQSFNAGLEAEKTGDWAAALEHYDKALAIKATPQLLLRAGVCQEKLGKLAAAQVSYERALEQARLADLDKVTGVVQERLAALRPRVPTLVVALAESYPDVQLRLDGELMANATVGDQLPVDPGKHVVEATAPGRSRSVQEITLREGQHEQLTLTLTAAAGGPAAGDGSTAGANYLPGALLVGGGAAMLVTFGVLLGVAQSKEGQVDDLCGGADRLLCPETERANIDGLLGDASTLRISGFVVGSVGAAAAIAGVVLLILPPDSAPDDEAVSWSLLPELAPGQVGASLLGRF